MTIPFAARPAIPIIGQAFTLKGGFSTVFGQCGCDGKGIVVLIGLAPNACPECKRVFAVKSVAIDAQGQLQAEIGVLQAPALVEQ